MQPVSMNPLDEHRVTDHLHNRAANGHEDLKHYLKLVNNCDESDPLLSETSLGACLSGIQLARVPAHRLAKLSQALNAETLIPTEAGLPRDFRGLSELMGFSSVDLEARFKRSHNPAKSLIEAFVARRHFECQRSASGNLGEATLNDLLKFLETLQRFDIIDDFLPDLLELAEEEEQQQQQKLQLQRQRSVQAVARLAPNEVVASNLLRIDPDGHQYDAFVCHAPEDEDHAHELIYMLEQHNKRIFTADNLLPGQLEFDSLVQIISARCRKVLILLTPNFVKSRECEFQSKFATEIDIKSGWSAKIIPIKCEPVEDALLPPLIRVLSKIDLTSRRPKHRDWQLKRLLDSLDLTPASMRSELTAAGSQLASRQQQQTTRRDEQSGSLHYTQPIVDLAYSQSSDSAMNLSTQWSLVTDHDNQRRSPRMSPSSIPSSIDTDLNVAAQPSSSSGPRAPVIQLEPWYKKIWDRSFSKRSVKPNKSQYSGNISPSNSSRAQLVVQEHSDEKPAD